ncbi:ECF RNA polymerase sigma factor SigE [Gemmata sp. SH-PL17]|uniref:RNA polymerase sigma factor n=1 Tax=Gemmata sp. SH-PL17 TaxID=1630693 RepID=UPI0004B47D9A|nr:sigma-70 family RNA polymerase sigma factor [Gemmata sp. SH-PL17]AMV24682.1 ECF RNA polymerase sigma factor SigE [Gemmata sp. SH-PL17]
MPTQLSGAVRRLGDALACRHAAGLADTELWERYVRNRDGSAFEALVRRHGPMVLGVCRRILRNEPDAEDAFQITFLVLVRRAASLRAPDAIANWLHGVATRTSLEARDATARRRAKEATVPPRGAIPEGPSTELRHVLDEELGRLAERYRVAVVLCDLEGKTRREVAEQLGWAEGTVASRLARGRSILARRLAHRGFAAALVAAALAGGTTSAGVPAGLVASTGRAATDEASMSAVLSGRGVPLTEGVGRSMFLTKLVTAAALVFGGTVLGLVSTTGATEAPAQESTRANPDDVRERVAEVKQQLQQLQQKLAKLEQEVPAGRDGAAAAGALAERFKHRVAFEIGDTETRDGWRIEIREVWGTRPKIEVGGQYLVRGKYKLPAGQKGKLYFYLTASTTAGAVTGTLDLQMQNLDKPEGEFTLVHGMENPGHFHLILTDPDKYSRWFANVYFGTGDTVWRKKP